MCLGKEIDCKPESTCTHCFNSWCNHERATESEGWVPGVFCAKRASWITASLGWTVVVDVGVGAEEVSNSRGTGEPSRDRLSGVWMPLESTPE